MISRAIIVWVLLVIGTILISVQIGLKAEALDDNLKAVERKQEVERDCLLREHGLSRPVGPRADTLGGGIPVEMDRSAVPAAASGAGADPWRSDGHPGGPAGACSGACIERPGAGSRCAIG